MPGSLTISPSTECFSRIPARISMPPQALGRRAWSPRTGRANLYRWGQLLFDRQAGIIRAADSDMVLARLQRLVAGANPEPAEAMKLLGRDFEFRRGDGIEGALQLADKSIDLLLTDPPYGISKAYTCESQVPKRLRRDGTDFIMPRGNFGDWDGPIAPRGMDGTCLAQSGRLVSDLLRPGANRRIQRDPARVTSLWRSARSSGRRPTPCHSITATSP